MLRKCLVLGATALSISFMTGGHALAQTPTAPQKVVKKTVSTPAAVKASLGQKTPYTPSALEARISYRQAQPLFDAGAGDRFALNPTTLALPTPPTDVVAKGTVLPASLKKHAKHITSTPYLLDSRPANPPLAINSVDRSSFQTPIRHQGDRGTCTVFSSLAAMEAVYKRTFNVTLDISEEHAYSLFTTELQRRPCTDRGFHVLSAAKWLQSHRFCNEVNWPYVRDINNCQGQITSTCSQQQNYGIISYEPVLRRENARGSELHANNTNFLEGILTEGYEVVYAVHVAGTDWSWQMAPSQRVIDVQVMRNGDPAPSLGSHAMLLVGFNRSGDYFVFKNSWGRNRGYMGYYRLSYQYLQVYGIHGFYITRVDR